MPIWLFQISGNIALFCLAWDELVLKYIIMFYAHTGMYIVTGAHSTHVHPASQ